ncbi:DNA repair helicase [Striga asiatica]|uniref:DNA repair helicase n=1 Tax=Striga asiatica TaxID=4170 RepID=A0A5A7Q1L0_STRAF|nr:DNA repair helicase [Striga asiatica]
MNRVANNNSFLSSWSESNMLFSQSLIGPILLSLLAPKKLLLVPRTTFHVIDIMTSFNLLLSKNDKKMLWYAFQSTLLLHILDYNTKNEFGFALGCKESLAPAGSVLNDMPLPTSSRAESL